MKSVHIVKHKLLDKLIENHDRHVAEFIEASTAYRAEAVAALRAAADVAEAGGVVKTNVGLVQPVSFAKDYERAILMLKMSMQDVIELSTEEFDQYVMDNWAWKSAFRANTQSYVGAGKAG